MARGDVNDVLRMRGETITASARGNTPTKQIRETLKSNIHKANRIGKRLLTKKVKQKLRGGVPGEGYAEEYAKDKSKDPRNQGANSSYNTSGPVDFEYSGRLFNELVGRGRAKPSEPSLQMWLGLRHPGRTRPQSAPGGGGITYRRLTEILRGQKPGPEGNPFSPTPRGREQIAREVADKLMGQD